MRRATFLSSLFTLLLVVALFQIISVYWSPFGASPEYLKPTGRFSTQVHGGDPADGEGDGLVRITVAGEQNRKGYSELDFNAALVPTPTQVMARVSPETTSLMQRVLRRRELNERRRAAQQEGLPVRARVGRLFRDVSKKVTGINIVEEGRVEPPADVAESLHLRTEYAVYNDEELLARHKYLDIVYTWVNGSEINHLFRKYYRRNAVRKHMFTAETASPPSANSTTPSSSPTAQQMNGTTQASERQVWVPDENGHLLQSFSQLEGFFTGHRNRVINSRDRESDELRYSTRSLDQYVEWHHGRIIIVSPGHCPLWLDHHHNFFARSQRPVGHVRRRIVCVHQDTIVPANQRLTFNTNTIEPHVYKLKNLSQLFVQFNDDYFVNHPTTVTDFVNKWGGATLLHEGGEVRGARLAHRQLRKIWLGGVYHSNSFNIREIEEVSPLVIPPDVAARVRQRAGLPPPAGAVVAAAAEKNQSHQGSDNGAHLVTARRKLMEVAMPRHHMKLGGGRPVARIRDEQGREITEQQPQRKRYFLKHAPFVYCKRMFEHLAERYHTEFTAPGLLHPHRHKDDLLMPFIHNAFIMDRPWAGSPRYLPHLVGLMDNASRPSVEASSIIPTTLTVQLNNHDGCAPAYNKIGEAARSLLVIFIDDLKENQIRMERIAEVDPVFFALNDGFSRAEAASQLQKFMASKYPEPSIFERSPPNAAAAAARSSERAGSDMVGLDRGDGTTSVDPATVEASFDAVMSQPVVLIVRRTDEAATCPFLRSLRLGLPEHSGDVTVVVVEDGNLAVPLRQEGDALPDTLPRLTTECRYNPSRVRRVTISAAQASQLTIESMTSIALAAAAADNIASLDTARIIAAEAPVEGGGIDACALAAPARSSRRRASVEGASQSNKSHDALSSPRASSLPKPAVLKRDVVDLLPGAFGEVAAIGAIVFDLRRFADEGPFHLAMIGQLLAVEDFVLLRRPSVVNSSSCSVGDVGILYLSPASQLMAAARSYEHRGVGLDAAAASPRWDTNWIVGLSDTQLRFTYPVPYAAYEVAAEEPLHFTYGDDRSWLS